MEQDNWDADMRLKKYIYDYLLKRKFHATAEAFMAEGEVPTGPVAIDAPEGFLFEWWSVFWDIFVARNDASHSEPATAYLEIQRMKAREEQNMAMQQQNAQLQRGNLNHSPHGGSSINIHPDGVTGQPSMSPLAMNNAQSMELEISDASSIAFLRSAIERQSQLLPCNSGNMSVEQQIPSRAHLDAEVNSEVMDAAQNSMPLDPSIYGQATLQSKSRLGEADASGQNQGVTSLPLKDGPLIMKMSQMQQSSSLPQDQLLQQQQVSQQMSTSGPADSTGTENTASPSPASPQSTHRAAPGEGTTAASSMCQTAQKNISPEGNEVLEFTSYLLDDLDHFGVLVSLDKEVASFLTSDGGAGNNFSGTREEDTKGIEFPLGEIGCIRKGNSIVTCCHFSSDGKFLASAGHDKKVTFWNMDTLQTVTTPEEHKSVVTDVRFRPNSTYLASASVDQSVRLWDAANPSFYLRAYTGHTSPIMSLDFNPVKTELCCFCDDDNEIHYLDVNTFNCTRSCKGGSAQVRFQATAGKLLAAASDKVVSIFDVETDTQLHTFQGHPDMVSYICWNPHGEYLASVSQNMVKVWSLTSGQSIQEHFSTKANQFHSCDFHPDYLHVLVIGGVSCLDMWSIAENKSILIPAHENIISALSHTSVSNLVASASHDSYVKIWK